MRLMPQSSADSPQGQTPLFAAIWKNCVPGLKTVKRLALIEGLEEDKLTMNQLKRFWQASSVETSGRILSQYAYVAAGMIFILLSSGLIFGWSSLLLVFQAEGVYSELCENSTSPATSKSIISFTASAHYTSMVTGTPVTEVKTCDAQVLRFDLVFLLGLLAVFLPSPLHGWIMDRFGARVLNALASCLIIIGCILFAFGYHTTKLDLLIPALMFTSSGGMGLMLSLFTFARIVPLYLSIILAFYNVGFDSSPLVFYVYVKLYQNFGITPRSFFLCYLVLPILSLCMSFFWPRGVGEPEDPSVKQAIDSIDLDLPESGDSQSTSDDSVVALETHHETSSSNLDLETDKSSEVVVEPSSELGPTNLYPLPFIEQVKTLESILLCIFHINCSFWMSTYMGSVQARLKGIESDISKVDRYTEIFGLVLSLAFLTAPIVGYSIHKLKLLKALFVCITLAIVWNLAQFLPFEAQIATFILFAVVRAWYYSIIFNLVTHIFGWSNVGKLWGVYNAISGIITFGFYGVSWAVIHWFNGSYFIPSVVSTCTFSASLLFAFYLQRRKTNFEKSFANATSLDSVSEAA